MPTNTRSRAIFSYEHLLKLISVEVGEATAKVWGLYLAGSRLGFERNQIQLHQVLAVKLRPGGAADFPLRPDWGSV